MAYNPPSLSECIKQIEGDITLELGIEVSLPIVCSERAIAFAVGAAKCDLHDHLSWLSKQIVPGPESDDLTIEAKAAYEGVPRKLARKAKGTASLSVSDGAALPLDAILTSKSGTRYLITGFKPSVNDTIVAYLQAQAAGKSGNLLTGEILTFVNPPVGIQSQATIIDMHGGTEIETITELLNRLYFRKQNPPMGGALHDYEAWTTEVHGVTRAWAYDAWHGGSTVGITLVCDNEHDIIPTDNKIAEVSAYIYKHKDPASGQWVGRPAGIETVVFTLSLKPIQLNIAVIPDTPETRASVITQLNALERDIARPGGQILLSHVRNAIGTALGVIDYTCSLNANITSDQTELITFEDPKWLTR